MDRSLEIFRQILDKFSHLRGRMRNLAQTFGQRFPGASVQHSLDFVQYDARQLIEIYLDIAFGAGRSLCWWIDVEPIREFWKIDASLRRDEGTGEESVWRASYESASIEELFAHLSLIFDELELHTPTIAPAVPTIL